MTDLRDQLQSTLSSSYTLERELGGGGMSRVFVADETRLGRKVVVKVLAPELAAGISADRFQREIRVAASLQQANIVPVLSAGETNGLPYYTMPFVEGESLRSRLAHGLLPVAQVVGILRDVARALSYAHARGIVHRDIKPDNVLLSHGAAVVTDFGIAKALSASRTSAEGVTLTQLGTTIGTPAYMAPEQAAGDPDTGPHADFYAFGCMAYELLTGHPPFHGLPPHKLITAHMNTVPEPLAAVRPDVPASLASIVDRCLAKDPAERPESADALVAALEQVSTGPVQQAMPAILLGGPGAFRRALLLYAAAFIIVAVLARAAIVAVGLPEWVFPGALIVMALGLPGILFTAYAQRVVRRMAQATPSLTPGGTVAPRAHGTLAAIAVKASPHLSWRRTTVGGVLAVGTFVALIGGFMLLRALGIGPAGSLLGAGKLAKRDLVIIADFGTSRADSSVGSIVAEATRANLSQSSAVTLMSPASVIGALRRMELPTSARVDEGIARQIALREGAKAIVSGDVTGLGTGFVITLRLVSADSGSVLASFQTTVEGPKELIAGVDEVARKLRAKIGESLKSVQGSPPLAQVTTASMDALRLYTEALYANNVENDARKSIALLKQAVALDSGFAMAWRAMGVAMGNVGAPPSERDFVYRMLFRHRDRLTEKERHLAEASYYSSGPGRDRTKAIAAYEAVLRMGDSGLVLNNLALIHERRREYARAESLYTLAIARNPHLSLPYTNILDPLHAQGKRAEVRAALERARATFPGNLSVIRAHLTILLDDGRYDSAAVTVAELAKSSNPRHQRIAARASASLHLLHGRIADAKRANAEMIRIDIAAGVPRPPLIDSLRSAEADAWFYGRPGRALQRLEEALAAHPLTSLEAVDRPYTWIARIYAQAGRPDRARAMLAEFTRAVSDTAFLRASQPDVQEALAEIALAENRAQDAIGLFRRADMLPDGPNGPTPLPLFANLGRAFDLAERPDSAIIYFERYLSTPAPTRIFEDEWFRPAIHKRLGELYDAAGNGSRAADHLRKFVTLWRNADPELQPRVADARRRLERIERSERR